jgi:hypothetical protein
VRVGDAAAAEEPTDWIWSSSWHHGGKDACRPRWIRCPVEMGRFPRPQPALDGQPPRAVLCRARTRGLDKVLPFDTSSSPARYGIAPLHPRPGVHGASSAAPSEPPAAARGYELIAIREVREGTPRPQRRGGRVNVAEAGEGARRRPTAAVESIRRPPPGGAAGSPTIAHDATGRPEAARTPTTRGPSPRGPRRRRVGRADASPTHRPGRTGRARSS